MSNLHVKEILVSDNLFSKTIELTFWQKLCVRVLKQGPIPRHVAIIMDGNRRFARTNNIEQIDGHTAGFSRLLAVMTWCRALGINELTVYAFSIENFKRSPEEVDNLLNLVRDKFESLWHERKELLKLGICVRAIGNLLLFPKDLQKSIAKVVTCTKNNDKYFLNLAISYTSREEMFSSVKKVLDGIQEKVVKPQEINEELFEQCFYTCDSPELDLLIRTSGEVRLSDFLLWQQSYTTLVFVNCLWPDFSFWELMFSVFFYQNQYQKIKAFKDRRIETAKTVDISLNNNNNNYSIEDEKIKNINTNNYKTKFYQYLMQTNQNLLNTMLNSDDKN